MASGEVASGLESGAGPKMRMRYKMYSLTQMRHVWEQFMERTRLCDIMFSIACTWNRIMSYCGLMNLLLRAGQSCVHM